MKNLLEIHKQYEEINSPYYLEKVKDYPLIRKIVDHNDNYIFVLKFLPYSKNKIMELEKCYEMLSLYGDLNVLKPIKNISGKFISFYDGNAFIITELLKECGLELPSVKWWSRTLSRLHSIKIEKKPKEVVQLKHIEKIIFKGAEFMDSTLQYHVKDLYQKATKYKFSLIYNHFLHGDPLYSNVMKVDNDHVLIDFENNFIGAKEYDIQRHLCDYAVHNDNLMDIYQYFGDFIYYYEQFGLKIKKKLLENLYIIDYCQTLSWLYIVTQDNSRDDFKRQKEELSLYKKALVSGKFKKTLRKIREL